MVGPCIEHYAAIKRIANEYSNTDESQKCYAKWKKTDTKESILYDLLM